MRSNRCIKVFALTAAMVMTRFSAASDIAGEWVGQFTGPFDSQYTAQYSHVTLKIDGTKLGGTWGSYAVAGTLAGAKVDLTLTDASGKPAGTLTGSLAGETLAGIGTVSAVRRPGGPALPPNAVTWKLTRAVTPPAAPKTYDFEPTS